MIHAVLLSGNAIEETQPEVDSCPVEKVISIGKEIGCKLLHTCGIKPISVAEVSDRYSADHVKRNYSIDACK